MKGNETATRRNDRGFTLIELMVVVLIIAILLGIAIPTFLGAQNKAKDRSAQSSAKNALTNAKTIYADSGVYTGATATALTAIEPALTFVATTSTGAKSVSVLTTDDTWYGAVMSETDTCFYIKDSIDTAAGGTTFAKVTSAATCVADASQTYTDGW